MTEATASKVDPWIFAPFLGEQRKVEYTLRGAELFERLTKRSLLEGYDTNKVSHITAFLLAGLVEHNRALVGDCDANGTPDETMRKLMEQIKSMGFRKEIWTALKTFGVAIKLAQPEAEPGNDETDPAPGESGTS